jgi:GxxExxY protein
MDLLVDDTVVVELKSCDQLQDLHKKQLLTYLRLSGKKVGLLLNFNEALLRNGVVRIVNGLQEPVRRDAGSGSDGAAF